MPYPVPYSCCVGTPKSAVWCYRGFVLSVDKIGKIIKSHSTLYYITQDSIEVPHDKPSLLERYFAAVVYSYRQRESMRASKEIRVIFCDSVVIAQRSMIERGNLLHKLPNTKNKKIKRRTNPS